MIAAIVALVIVAACLASCMLIVRRRQTPGELRGDWWTEFERDFWAYAARTPPRRGGRQQHHERRRPAGP